ncbi:MAG: thioredoxin family protein [Gemmatimonadetes bacterium]|nr:thioredoxin family protein [Gemmatimonadota bacterium]
MAGKRTVEVFIAGCACCDEALEMVRQMACPSCEVRVLDMRNEAAARRASELGVRSIPAIAVNGELASCCAARGPDAQALRHAGIGRPIV